MDKVKNSALSYSFELGLELPAYPPAVAPAAIPLTDLLSLPLDERQKSSHLERLLARPTLDDLLLAAAQPAAIDLQLMRPSVFQRTRVDAQQTLLAHGQNLAATLLAEQEALYQQVAMNYHLLVQG